MFNKYKYLILVIIVALSISGCTSSGDESSNIKLNSPIQNCKMVDVPYEVQVAYTEQEPYTANVDEEVKLKYEIIESTTTTTDKGFDIWAVGKVTIRNMDSETGSFKVEQYFSTLNDPKITRTSSQYIMQGESNIFREQVDIDLFEDFSMEYRVYPGTKIITKQVTKYRTVTMYRSETKYRQEEQCNQEV